MRILAVNPGSSSLKLSLIGDRDDTIAERELGDPTDPATERGIDDFLSEVGSPDAVGYRIVHGGLALRRPVLIDDGVRRELDAVAALAPLHVPPALHLIDALRRRLDVAHVACFDTAFHASLPAAAYTYAVPAEWRDLGVRRFGFHGLSCAWSLRRAAVLLERDPDDLRLIVAHLGSGASVTAIRGGHSVDTSMGFTPLEGLIMAMRSGTVDPGALLWLQLSRGVAPLEMSDALEHASGLLALAGTGDMRELLARAASGDADAVVARDAYVRRVCSHIGAMATSLDRFDALVFTGGVGENAVEVRTAVCAELRVLGVTVPASAPSPKRDSLISDPSAQVAVLVVFAREDLQIALEVREVIHRR